MNYNSATMLRDLYCWDCDEYFSSNKSAPNCPLCDSPAVTVVRSVVTGEQITGQEDNTDYSIGEKE